MPVTTPCRSWWLKCVGYNVAYTYFKRLWISMKVTEEGLGEILAVQLAGLTCRTLHHRWAPCEDCRRVGFALAQPFARSIMATAVPKFHCGGTVKMGVEESAAVTRGVDMLARLYTEGGP